MKKVCLTSGPRGSGKSTYLKTMRLNYYPKTSIISRDELLMELFGRIGLDPYAGEHDYALKILFERIKKQLFLNIEDAVLFLDCWNGYPSERRTIIKKLLELGADQVFCWQFIVPLDVCLNWFFKKQDSKGYTENMIINDYNLYYEQALNIENDGFDKVYKINPLQLNLPNVPFF